MKMNIPVRSLANLNWLLAVVFSGLVGIFLFIYTTVTAESIYIIVQSIISILAVGFVHIWIRLKLSRYKEVWSVVKQQLYQIAIGYAVTLLYATILSPVREVLADSAWRTITFQQQCVTVIVGSLAINILILVMHNFIIAYQSKSFIEVENARLRIANVEANNLLLKQQVHPHFLFNALNIVKSLYRTDVRAGDTYIVHLANFLRAAISSTSAKLVSVSDELTLCADYIAMQKIRFDNALHYNMKISSEESSHGFLPSFSLQPQLENAIKHNVITDEEPLIITLFIEDGYVVVQNNLQRKKQPVASTGYGLANLIKRYQLLSGDEVKIQDDETSFSVCLKILNK